MKNIFPVNTKNLYHIYTKSAQRRKRYTHVFMFAGLNFLAFLRYHNMHIYIHIHEAIYMKP